VAHYEYDPFGRSTTSTGTMATSFAHRFSTKPVDGPTGLYYYGYRFYDPATGRWPSRDPIHENGGVNLFGFVHNNSIDAVDFLGWQQHSIHAKYKRTRFFSRVIGMVDTSLLTGKKQ